MNGGVAASVLVIASAGLIAVALGFGIVGAGPLAAIGIAACILAAALFWRWMVVEGWTGRAPKYNKK